MKDIRLVLEELERHKERLLYAKEKIESWKELSPQTLEDPEKVETISKLQDSMGQKLFPLTLEFLGEETRNKPFIEKRRAKTPLFKAGIQPDTPKGC